MKRIHCQVCWKSVFPTQHHTFEDCLEYIAKKSPDMVILLEKYANNESDILYAYGEGLKRNLSLSS